MRLMRLRWFLCGAFTLILVSAAVAVADPSAVNPLAIRVAHLEKQENLQSRLDVLIGKRLDTLEQGPTVGGGLGAPITIAPRSWGTATAQCLAGNAVGGGFEANYPVEVGTSHLANGAWEVAAYNASLSQSVVFTATVVCL